MNYHDSPGMPVRLLRAFFGGRVYPIIVCALVMYSYVSANTVLASIVNLLLLAAALFVSDNIRPLIAVMPSFLYIFSKEHAITTEAGRTYLFTGENLTREMLKTLPFPIAAILLSLAFLLNGVMSDTYMFGSTAYGVLNIVTFFLAFYVFYLGMKQDDAQELTRYFTYVTALIALLIVAEMVYFFVSTEGVIVDGKIVKEKLLYGWGNCNTAGQCLAVLIPMTFLGVMRSKAPILYFLTATLTLGGVYLTLSRNGILFATLAYLVCIIMCCFIGKAKKFFRVIIPVGIVVIAVLAFIYRDSVMTLFGDVIERGLSDNGRYALWNFGIEAFRESPLFGKGFYGIMPKHLLIDVFPIMVHNTPIQLLASMGLFGFAAYLIYRIRTLAPFFKAPTLEKTMLGLSLLIVIGGSLLDNFIFYLPHMLYYPIALALAFKIRDEQE